ncbi:hypothetical protein ACFQ1I_39470 [Kitasatospora arboriphila]
MSTEIDDRRQSLLRQRLAGARRSRTAVPRLDLSAELPLSFGQRGSGSWTGTTRAPPTTWCRSCCG